MADRLLTVGEVAWLARVSEKTVYRALNSRALRAAKLGEGVGTWRVTPAAFDAWVEASTPTAALRPANELARRRRRSRPRSGSLRVLAAADRGGNG